MNYLKISITASPLPEWFADILAAELAETGFESFLETETGIEAFIAEDKFNKASFEKVISGQDPLIRITWSKELIPDQNWNEVWEKNYFKPLVVGNQCVIHAPFHKEVPNLPCKIVIEPNMAFGTGNHETTFMMLETILDMDLTNRSVLDMGCGTGILGILASMKGAGEVTAIDTDEWAFNGTRENAALNHIHNLAVRLGDATLLKETYDVIFANIHKNVLLNDIPVYAKCLKSQGELLISGFLTEDIPEMNQKAKLAGLKENGHKTKNNWVASMYIKTT